MKQMIRKRLAAVILTLTFITLLSNYFLQLHNSRTDMYRGSMDKFLQIEQILESNEQDTARIKHQLEQDCFIRAKAAAYIIQNHPEVIQDQQEMTKIANLLQVDEFHLFDTEGNLYAGSQPKYFGLNFNSGEQMRFFLPMLKDRTLELCQEITPNTAEQKLMQYAAVWREDGQGIVQIGLEPTRVLEAMKKNELSYIFSRVTAESGSSIYAVDPESGVILGSTDEELVGKNIDVTGLTDEQIRIQGRGFRAEVGGVKSYCVFSPYDSLILGITRPMAQIDHEVNRSTVMVAAYLLFVALLMIVSISRYIDRYIVDVISAVNEKLVRITEGDLDTTVEEESTPEFAKLSSKINLMVRSLLDNTNKLSKILEVAQVPIGVYEYSQGMKRVMVTGRVAEILRLTDEEAKRLFSDHALFEEWLSSLCKHPLDEEKGVYILPGEPAGYVRLENYFQERSILGMVVDVTEDITERRRIERERDVDLLTGLLSRRAFYRRMDKLFRVPGQLGCGMMVMADADNLKRVNDRYGHENGDRYLRGIADSLKSCAAKKRVIARLSGDEFALFFYGAPDRKTLEREADALRNSVAARTVELTDGTKIPVRFSVGCAFYPEDGENYSELLKCADAAMYQAKKQKNQTIEMQ